MIMFRNTMRRWIRLWLAGAVSSALLACSAPDLPEGLVYLENVAPDIVQDMRYATERNFVGARVDGYARGACILAKEAAQALRAAQALAAADGYSLIVFDCLRPQRAVDHFVRWARSDDLSTKGEYYPREVKADLFDRGYIAERSGHSRGATVDLGLVPLGQGAPAGDLTSDCTTEPEPPVLDFGTRFDCFDTLSNTRDARRSEGAAANRERLLSYMKAASFRNYAKEWWHFTLEDEPFPDTYFDFVIR